MPNSDGIKIALFHAVTVCKQVCVCLSPYKILCEFALKPFNGDTRASQPASQPANHSSWIQSVKQSAYFVIIDVA